MQSSAEYDISTDRNRLDLPMIHDFLRNSYWAKEIPLAVVEKSIQNSFCFGAYYNGKQIAFARVITDYATFGYIADVFVLPKHRGQGISKKLMQAIMDHPELKGLRRFFLATRDAHSLYQKFGFRALLQPENVMTIHFPDVYKNR